MKNDTLKKSSTKSKIHRESQVKEKAYAIGWIGALTVMLLLIIWRTIHKESSVDIMMILFAQSATALFYQYRKIPGRKINLIGGILATIAFGLALAALLSEYGIY